MDEDDFLNEDDVDEVIELGEDEMTQLQNGLEDLADSDPSDDDGETEEDVVAQQPPERDDAKLIFKEHMATVFCCDVDVNGKFAVTGGQDDLAYVWDIASGNVEFKCTGHKDSVTSALFNKDGTLVATGDMSGELRVWKVTNQSLLWEDAVRELTWIQWHPATNVLFAGSAEGDVTFWRLPNGECKLLPSPSGMPTPCGKILPDGTRALIGYEDGSLRVFDLRSCNNLHVLSGQGNTGAITCLDAYHDNNLILAGRTDGTCTLVTTQNGKVVFELRCCGPEPSSVESAAFCPLAEHPMIAACLTTSGELSVWDLGRQVRRCLITIPGGGTRLLWLTKEPNLVVAGLGGAVSICDALKGTILSTLLGHWHDVLDICLTKDSETLISTSDDHTARVFKMPALTTS